MFFKTKRLKMAKIELIAYVVYVRLPTRLQNCYCCDEVIYSDVYKQAIRCCSVLKFTGIELCLSCHEIILK